MKQAHKKKLFYILSGMLGFSLIGSYINTPDTVYRFDGVNLNPNVVTYEISKLEKDLANYQKDYFFLYQQKTKIIEDFKKEDINIPEDIVNHSINLNFEKLFNHKAISFNDFEKRLKDGYNITPTQFEESIENDLIFNFFANSMELINVTSTSNNKIIKDTIGKKITIEYKNDKEELEQQTLTYEKNKDLFLEVLIINYNKNEENNMAIINNEKRNYIIKKIEKINDFTVDENKINDITNKSIINYYF
jgi:hypothetical protein